MKVLPQALEPLKLISSTQTESHIFKQRDIYLFDIFKDENSTQDFLQVPGTAEKENDTTRSIAVLNQESTTILSKLGEFCTFEAYSHRESWDSILSQKVKIEKKTCVLVDVIIYGKQEQHHDVGEYLTQKKVYLQEPDYWQPGLNYNNPHFLDLSGVIPDTTMISNSTATSFFDLDIESPLENSGEEMNTKGLLKQRIATAFKNLTRGKTLKRIEADVRIITPLKQSVIFK